ncbi:hypothetical protein [Paracoccus actinidiae]|jgi:hypothetical protein|uniref:hypothetical protein n=1 Tax=Paracoccus actinidiae TaxID=3064531 RepID=UPI0027D2F02E|nr:hypothetical protein [Paracoccus sp. M09]
MRGGLEFSTIFGNLETPSRPLGNLQTSMRYRVNFYPRYAARRILYRRFTPDASMFGSSQAKEHAVLSDITIIWNGLADFLLVGLGLHGADQI